MENEIRIASLESRIASLKKEIKELRYAKITENKSFENFFRPYIRQNSNLVIPKIELKEDFEKYVGNGFKIDYNKLHELVLEYQRNNTYLIVYPKEKRKLPDTLYIRKDIRECYLFMSIEDAKVLAKQLTKNERKTN